MLLKAINREDPARKSDIALHVHDRNIRVDPLVHDIIKNHFLLLRNRLEIVCLDKHTTKSHTRPQIRREGLSVSTGTTARNQAAEDGAMISTEPPDARWNGYE